METCDFTLIIPSLDPDEHLPAVVEAAIEAGVDDIVLVDDGSRPECRHYFTELAERPEVTLLTHELNQGKGAALKTAFAWFLSNRPDRTGVVTADGDGQHAVEDILACGIEMNEGEPAVILGCRDFSQRDVPLRSRIGNRLTCLVFRVLLGMCVSDTQTGLRAIPARYIEPLMAAGGSRYEFETNMLLLMDALNVPSWEVTIQTLYPDQNRGSHFHPLRDSLRVYGLIIKYAPASLLSRGRSFFLRLRRRLGFGRKADRRRSVQENVPGSPRRARAGLRTSTIVKRTVFALFLVLFVSAFGVIALLHTLVTGPSDTVRDFLVLSATQASATKWVPGLFIGQERVDEIVARSHEVQEDVIPMSVHTAGGGDAEQAGGASDEWADAIDGMILKTHTDATYTAYILLVRDPSRVYVGTSSDYKSGKPGIRIFDIVERDGAVAAINAGEFDDPGGAGTGSVPMGLTYALGKCVWNDGLYRTFIGLDSDNILHAYNSMTREQADKLGIRDGVSFQNGNVLITNDGENVTLHYAEGNLGRAQRTAIGQRADGTLILVVTDGRSAGSMGATRDDVIDLMVELGAVTAGMLDGGTSAMMYYEDYYTKYNFKTTAMDEYQLQGLVNRYKAFMAPRGIPTYFLVAPET